MNFAKTILFTPRLHVRWQVKRGIGHLTSCCPRSDELSSRLDADQYTRACVTGLNEVFAEFYVLRDVYVPDNNGLSYRWSHVPIQGVPWIALKAPPVLLLYFAVILSRSFWGASVPQGAKPSLPGG